MPTLARNTTRCSGDGGWGKRNLSSHGVGRHCAHASRRVRVLVPNSVCTRYVSSETYSLSGSRLVGSSASY
eukprot:5225738-Pleurochrysis_carterae.AAC.2